MLTMSHVGMMNAAARLALQEGHISSKHYQRILSEIEKTARTKEEIDVQLAETMGLARSLITNGILLKDENETTAV